DSSSQYVGLNLEQTFSPTLLGSLRAGYQNKSFDADEISDESSPYFDAKLTMVASKATRISAGIGYSMFEADVYPFTSQDRTLASLSVAHDITARFALYVTGSYQLSEYSGNQSLDQTASDGEEEILQASARLAYMINRSNWIELGYQYLDLSSDFREEFDRNRVSIGWRTNL
ncbi:MAG: outer membrane beta-barrel protein, partial [Kiritimatiellae bacterium]|nr:outer membrane beta-barrel protein [Kiritimatiellia bacterium]